MSTTHKVVTTYTVTEFVEVADDSDLDSNDIAGIAHDKYLSFEDLNMVDFEVQELVGLRK
jgi:hypothetical protein